MPHKRKPGTPDTEVFACPQCGAPLDGVDRLLIETGVKPNCTRCEARARVQPIDRTKRKKETMQRRIQPDDKLFYAAPLPDHLIVETRAHERFLAPLSPLDNSPREHTPYFGNYTLTPLLEMFAHFYRGGPPSPSKGKMTDENRIIYCHGCGDVIPADSAHWHDGEGYCDGCESERAEVGI